jgi:hypothetical protein
MREVEHEIERRRLEEQVIEAQKLQLVSQLKVDSGHLPRGAQILQEGGNPRPSMRKSLARILVVDDDVAVRQLTSEMLIRASFTEDAAPDGAAGWEALQADHYDLVVTDNRRPSSSLD